MLCMVITFSSKSMRYVLVVKCSMWQGGCGKEFCSKKRTFTLNCVIPCWLFIPTQYKSSFLYFCGVLSQQYFIVMMIWTTQLMCCPHDHFSFCQERFGLCFQLSRWSHKRDEEATLEEELTGAEGRRQHAFLWRLIFALVCSQTEWSERTLYRTQLTLSCVWSEFWKQNRGVFFIRPHWIFAFESIITKPSPQTTAKTSHASYTHFFPSNQHSSAHQRPCPQ